MALCSQDEVDPKCWVNNEKIAAWLDQQGMNATELYPYFENKVSEILHRTGKRMMAWDDVFEKAPGTVQPGRDVVHAWRGPAIAEAAVAQERESRQVGPEVGPTSALYSCSPT